jgi:hypothetical protein
MCDLCGDPDDVYYVRLTEIIDPKAAVPRTAIRTVAELHHETIVHGELRYHEMPLIRTIPQAMEIAAIEQAREWNAYCTAEIIEGRAGDDK